MNYKLFIHYHYHISSFKHCFKGDKVINYYQKSEIFEQKSIKKITRLMKYA